MKQIPLKTVVFVLSLLQFFSSISYILDFGFPSLDDEDFYFCLLVTITPLITLFWIYRDSGLPIPSFGEWLPDSEEMKLRKELRMAEMKKKLNEMKK